ncbi:MAG: helix-turn-helix transcriptional regulator [Clostridia bacterium]|nr:helix-turn-helix transcriptional regulator [Clostridia bacterium]
MEFNEKLQELRKQKGITQEELANFLFVSRTAISKWESGKGYPNIDSIKALAKFFSVTVDELLSSDELISIAEEDNKLQESRFRDLVFGLLDISVVMFFFLPFFAHKSQDVIQAVSLTFLTDMSILLKIAYYGFIVGMIVMGITTLALQNSNCRFWVKNKSVISLILNTLAVFLFIVSPQPYAAMLLFIFLIIKVSILIKKH